MATATKTFTFVITSLLEVVTVSLPDGVVGKDYAVQLEAKGGVGPYTWTASELPEGFTCSPEGLISGVPVHEGLGTATVVVTDSGV